MFLKIEMDRAVDIITKKFSKNSKSDLVFNAKKVLDICDGEIKDLKEFCQNNRFIVLKKSQY